MTLNDHGARVEGTEDVDLGIALVKPKDIQLTTETKSRACPGLKPNGDGDVQTTTTQVGLIASSKEVTQFRVVLYPRLKTEKPPIITSPAEGKAARVQSGTRTDYVFVASSPFSFTEGNITFDGICGSIQLLSDRVILNLGSAGRIVAGGHELNGQQATSWEWGRSP